MSRQEITATLIDAARSQDPAGYLNVRAGDLLTALDPEFVNDAPQHEHAADELQAVAGV